MKKLIKSLTALTVLSGLFYFTSCQEVIFDEIRNEVKLEDAQISGDVSSIVRYSWDSDCDGTPEEYIFLQNGRIWYKPLTAGAHNWKQFNKPDTGAKYSYVNKLAANGTCLYAEITLVNQYDDDGENESDGCQLWCWDGSSWSQIAISSVSTFGSGKAILFCTNAPITSHRSAYVNLAGYVYELDGTSATYKTTTQSTDDDGNTVTLPTYPDPIPTYKSVNCAYYSGHVYFSSANSMTTDEYTAWDYTDTSKYDIDTTDSDTSLMSGSKHDAEILFYSSGDVVRYTSKAAPDSSSDSTAWTSVDLNCATIYSMAVTSSSIILGTEEGIYRVSRDSATSIASSTSSFLYNSNARSALSEYYQVYCVFSSNPALPEAVSKSTANAFWKASSLYGTTIFEDTSGSTSATEENCGLWSYYSSRGKWNRE